MIDKTFNAFGVTFEIVDREPTKPQSFCWSGSPEPSLFDITVENWPIYSEDPNFVDISWKVTITILGESSLYRGKTFVRKANSAENAIVKSLRDLVKFIAAKRDAFNENEDPSLEETEADAELMTILKIIDKQFDLYA